MERKTIHRKAIVTHSCKEMYALVSDIPSYNQFLPYCTAGFILSSKGDIVNGKMVFSYFGLSYEVITKNTMSPHSRIGLSLIQGDMETLDGQWLFRDLKDGHCEVSLDLDLVMHDGLMYRVFNRIMDRLADAMVDAFIDRSYQVYGLGED